MMFSASALAKIYACPLPRASNWEAPLVETFGAFEINSPERQAAFLAQIGHESGRLRFVREVWGPTSAQSRYEGRADLGNIRPGDGYKYLGRGLLQITGRANYASTTLGLQPFGAPDFEEQPGALEVPKWAAMSAGLFWSKRNLNALADAGDFERITKKINGGLNGQDDRLALWSLAKHELGIA